MTQAKTLPEFKEVALKLKERRLGQEPETKLGWYMRYMPEESRDCYNDYLVHKKFPNGLEKKASSKIEEEKNNVNTEINVEENLGDMFNA
jgi:hypothetical protein